MFLSKLFKLTRAKVLIVLAGLSMTLGVGAAISTVAATQQNEVVETKAATSSDTSKAIYFDTADSYWVGGGAWFCAWVWKTGSSGYDGQMYNFAYDDHTGLYRANIPADANKMALFRMKENTSHNNNYDTAKNNSWTRNEDLSFTAANDYFKKSSYDAAPSFSTKNIKTKYGYFLVGSATNGWIDGSNPFQASNRLGDGTGTNIAESNGIALTANAFRLYVRRYSGTSEYYNLSLRNYNTDEFSDGGKTGNKTVKIAGTYKVYFYFVSTEPYLELFRSVTVNFYSHKDSTSTLLKTATDAFATNSAYNLSDAPTLTNYYGYSHIEWYKETSGTNQWNASTSRVAATTLDLYAIYSTASSTTIYVSLTFEWEKFYPSAGSKPTITVTDTNGQTDTPSVTEVNADYGIISFPAKNMASFTVTKDTYTCTVNKDGSKNFYVMTYWNSSSDFSFANYTYNGSATLPGYYLEGTFNSWSATNAGHFTRPTNQDDRGQLMSFSMSADDECKVVQIIDPSNTPAANWHGYSALYSNLDNELATGTEDSSNIRATKNATYNIYVMRETDGKMISFVNLGDAAKYGYVYVPANATLSSYSVVAMVDEETIANTTLASIANPVTTTNVSFNGAQLKRFQIFNLGGNSGRIPTSVTVGAYNIASVSKAASEAAAAVYYIPTASTSSLTSVNSLAAKAVFNIGTTIASVGTHHSVCEISQPVAISLCTDYDAGKNSTYMSSATISTWDGSNTINRGTPVYSGDPVPVELSAIRVELGNIAGGDYVIATASFIPGAPNGNESPLTMTLWIVLGCGVAGLGAIGTAYFVSKKKGRHQA